MLSSVSQLFQDNTTVILGAVAGLGAVSAYGLTTPCLGDSKINGKIWEEHVRHRVRSTFAYVLVQWALLLEQPT
uniref:Uncharacterized protein n=1 Tax=Ditylenchus dipsaci TaxID=166011 RepID=A0A915EH95_9BILA